MPGAPQTNSPNTSSDERSKVLAVRVRFVTCATALLVLLALVACGPAQQQAGSTATATLTTTAAGQTVSPTANVAGTTPTAPAEAATATEQPAATGTTDTAGTFSNPVLRGDFADPFVLKEGATYYAYATNASGRNIQVATSPDLVKWTLLSDAMPALPTWAKLGGSLVWAPEVMKIGDKFLLYYTARDKASNKQCVGVATSDKPEGKYRDTNPAPLVCQAEEGGTIDANPFLDGDKLYLYYKNDGNCCSQATYLYVSEMSPDGLSLVGEPTRLVRNDKAWEGRVVEAPTMWKQDGKYYLFFSANNYAGFEYAVGYANCETPTGPCEDAPENPILASRMKEKPLVIGPGHQSIIEDDDGEAWLAYHVWDVTSAGLRGNSRFMWIDRLVFEGGKPVVKGPTSVPQPVP
ncbi:MAG TPA: glycoside hydrolase family 43 protein [Chloroflexia bacterium]|nr:glycoside hydrolase family 43 protein [Chloroflexia bacterium]